MHFLHCRRKSLWTDALDEALAREVITWAPFDCKPRTKGRGQAWKEIAQSIKENYGREVTERACKDRFEIIKSIFEKKMRAEIASSGKNSVFYLHISYTLIFYSLTFFYKKLPPV